MTHPDYLIACVGGGSNAAGTIYHYIDDERVRIVLAEAGGKGIDNRDDAPPPSNLGKMGIIHGARTLVMQNEDGQIEEPYSISAGLDYPGIGPIHANLAVKAPGYRYWLSMMTKRSDAAYRVDPAGRNHSGTWNRAHALGALEKINFKPEDVVVLTVSGRGDKDIETYWYISHEQVDY